MKSSILSVIVCLFSLNILAFKDKNDGEFILRCFGCHGTSGVTGYTYFPNLAGQDYTYIFNQIKNFRDGNRKDLELDAMPYMVSGMTDDQLKGLAQTFNKLPKEKVSKSEMSEADIEAFIKGRNIINGQEATCRYCHLANDTQDGPKAPGYPSLTGQQKGYLVKQIKAFKEKKRWNPIMNDALVAKFTDEEIEAMAVYFRYLKAE